MRSFDQRLLAGIDAVARAPQRGPYLEFAPDVYERGAAAVARRRSPEAALNDWLSDRRMPQSSFARDMAVANQMMSEFKGIVLDELAYQGGLADQEGRTAALVWNGVQSTFVDMFLPGSMPELAIGAAGGAQHRRIRRPRTSGDHRRATAALGMVVTVAAMTNEPKPTAYPEEIAEAKRTPNGWVYRIDGQFSPDESVPPEAVIGAWKVDENGKIAGDFILNPGFKPRQK